MTTSAVSTERVEPPDARPAPARRFTSAAGWLVANGVITLLLGAGYWILVARRASVADLGRATTDLSQIMLAANLGVVGIKHSIARALAAENGSRRRLVVLGTVAALIATVAATLLVELVTHGLGLGATSSWTPAGTAITALLAMIWAVFVLQDSLLTAIHRTRVVTAVNAIHGVGKLAVLAVIAGGADRLVTVSWFVPLLVTVPAVHLLVWRVVSGDARTAPWPGTRALLTAMGAEHLASAIWLLLTLGMPSLVLALAGAEASGAWYLAFSLGYGLYLVTSAIGSATIVEVAAGSTADASQEPTADLVRMSRRYALMLVLPAAIVGAVCAPLAVPLFGSEYVDVVPVLRLVALGAVGFVFVSTAVNVARGRGESGRVAAWHVGLVVTIVPLSVVLVPSHGAIGAGLAWMTGLCAVAVVGSVAGRSRGDGHRVRVPISLGGLRSEVDGTVSAAASLLGDDIAVQQVLSNRQDVLVATAVVEGRSGVVRVARGTDAIGELERHVASARGAQVASVAGALLVPEVYRFEADAHTGVAFEAHSVGRELGEAPSRDRLIAGVELAEAVVERFDDDDRALALTEADVRELFSTHVEVIGVHTNDEFAATLIERLCAGLVGRTVALGLVHGDLTVANVLAVDGEPTAIVDWETSLDAAPRFIDAVSLRLSAARTLGGQEYGTLVVAALRGADEVETVRLAPAGLGVDTSTAVLATWVFHTAANLRKDERYGRGSLWYKRNVAPVARQVAGPGRAGRIRSALHRSFVRLDVSDAGPGSTERSLRGVDRGVDTGVSAHAWLSCLPLSLIGIALWIAAVASSSPTELGSYGLFPSLGPAAWVGVGLLCAAFVLAVVHRAPGWFAWGQVAVFASLVHATPAWLYGTPRYPWTWKHVGIVEYIDRTGGVDRGIESLPIYHNWPGFFSLVTAVSDLTGIDPVTIARWAPVFLGLAQLGAAVYVMRVLSNDRAALLVAGWLFVLFNWVGQEYFSPQALGFVLHLLFLGLVLRLFGESLPGQVAYDMRTRLALSLVALQLLVLIVASHQLTPLMLMLSLLALVVTRQLRGAWPIAVTVALTALWAVSIGLPYVTDNAADVVSSFGSIVDNATVGVTEPVGEPSDAQALVSLAGKALTVLAGGLAVWGAVARWRHGSRDVALLALLVAPALALGLNDFDGEMIFRVVLFTSPFVALLAAHLLVGTGPSRVVRRVRPLALGGALVLLLPLFFLAHYGKERQYFFSTDEVAMVTELLTTAEPGSLIIEGNRNYPNQFVNYEQFELVAFDREPVETQWELLDDPEALVLRWLRGHDGDAYVLLTDSMNVAADELGFLPPGELASIRHTLASSPDLEIVMSNDAGVVLALAGATE